MGADAALIQAFSRLADAEKRDWSGVLQAQKEGGDILTEGITKTADIIAKGIQDKAEAKKQAQEDLLKAQNEAEKELNRKRNVEKNYTNNLFKKQMFKVSEALIADGAVGANYSDFIMDKFTVLNDELEKWNTGERTPENTREIQKIFNRADQVTKQVVKYRGDLQTYTQAYADNGTPSELSPAADAADTQFLSLTANDETRKTKFDDKDEMYIGAETGEIDSVTQEPIIKWVHHAEVIDIANRGMKEIEGEGRLTVLDNEMVEQGEDLTGGDFDLEKATSKIKMDVFYPQEGPKPNIADLAQRPLGNREYTKLSKPEYDSGGYEQGSWAYALQEHPDFQREYYIDDIRAYDNAGVEVPDLDNDPTVVSREEAAKVMMTPGNIAKVIDLLINPHKEGGNYDVTAGLMSEFFGEQQQVLNAKARQKAIAVDNAAKGKGKTVINW